MSVLSGLLQGINEGIEKQRQEKNKRADIEAENAKARGMEILKGIIGGDIEETQNPQEAALTQPGEVIKRGLFGKAETTPGKMYKRRERGYALPEIKEGQMLETSYNEYGEPKGFKIGETPERKLERDIQEKELKSMAEKLPNLERAEETIKSLKGLFESGWKPESVKKEDMIKGVTERLRGKTAIPMQSWTQTNPALRTYLQDKEAFASMISKGGFMEAGVLTNQDIQRALKSLPNPGDSKEIVNLKWKTLENVLSKARSNFEKKKSQYTGVSKETDTTKLQSIKSKYADLGLE